MQRASLIPVIGCQVDKVFSGLTQIAAPLVAGLDVPGGMAGQGEEGHSVMPARSVKAGHHAAAHVGGRHVDDGLGPGGLKQDGVAEIGLAEHVVHELPHSGTLVHVGEGLIAQEGEIDFRESAGRGRGEFAAQGMSLWDGQNQLLRVDEDVLVVRLVLFAEGHEPDIQVPLGNHLLLFSHADLAHSDLCVKRRTKSKRSP